MSASSLCCGNCGGGTFKIDGQRGRGPDCYDAVTATCITCNSATVMRVTTPMIQFDWAEGADGILAPMERKV